MSKDGVITKTVWQYSKPLAEDTMEILKGIALDYCKVKNYVYQRYSGIRSLDKLTPVYSILNEMRYCGLREQLNLPAVYYELAIADAVADIKAEWGIVKKKIGERVTANERLGAGDKMYLRTVLKLNHVYASVLTHQEYELPQNVKDFTLDVKHLNNLLCRLTRKYLVQPKTDNADSFRISPNGYSYEDGAIRIVCRTPRKRIAIPLKDGRTFDRQIRIQIKENFVLLAAPVEAKIKKHDDYTNTVYLHIGYKDMFTLSDGKVYGKALEDIVSPETERLAAKNRERRKMYNAYDQSVKDGNIQKADKIETNNLGRLKYDRQKERERRKTVVFINSEINRMLAEEKPGKIIVTKPITKNKAKYSKSVNRKLSRSFQNYIRERLAYKCRVHSIELLEIDANGTGSICSSCGETGKRKGFLFVCESCGMESTAALNSARNIQKKYNC